MRTLTVIMAYNDNLAVGLVEMLAKKCRDVLTIDNNITLKKSSP